MYDEGRFSEAREAFVTAHEAVEALRGEIIREETKRELAEKNADLYARLVYCCLHDEDEAAARRGWRARGVCLSMCWAVRRLIRVRRRFLPRKRVSWRAN